MKKQFTLSKVEKLPDSHVLIEGDIEFALLEKHRENALAKIQKDAEIPGFRKGHVPEHILIERVGELSILGEAAEEALDEVYPKIVESEKLKVIGHPQVSITKLAPNNPLGFKITVAVLPEFKLPDYKKFAKEAMKEEIDLSITDKDIEDVIMEVRKNFAHMELHRNGEHTHDHPPIKDEDLPEVTDEFVKKVGDFKDVADFRTKITENLRTERERRGKEKKRTTALESMINATDIALPHVLVESEQQKLLAQFKDDIARAGVTYEDYLAHIKKSEAEILDEWKETAEKKAKVQLILNKISEEENIVPDSEKIRTETEKILIAYPGSDPVRARLYVAQMMLNESVMEFLENLK